MLLNATYLRKTGKQVKLMAKMTTNMRSANKFIQNAILSPLKTEKKKKKKHWLKCEHQKERYLCIIFYVISFF